MAEFSPMEYIDNNFRKILQTEEEIIDLSNRLSLHNLMCWDVETTGLFAWNTLKPITKAAKEGLEKSGRLAEGIDSGRYKMIGTNAYEVVPAARICGHAIKVGDFSCYIPIEHEVAGELFKNVDDSLFIKYILPHFHRENFLIVNHNIKFDLHVLRAHYRSEGEDIKFGFVPKAKVCDTMVLAHMCNENSWEWDNKGRPIFKLKVLGKKFYSADADDQEQFMKDFMKKNKLERYSQVPIEILGPYAVRDVELVDAVYTNLMKNLEEEWKDDNVGLPLQRLIEDDMRFLRILEEVYSFGIHLDINKTWAYFEEAFTEMKRCRQEISDILGEDLNPSSPKQVIKHCGVKNAQEKTLKDKIKEDPNSKEAKIIKLVMEYKSWEKVKGSFYEQYLIRSDVNGFIHPEMFQVATVTSRLACRNPNFQALPRPNDADEITTRVYKVRNVVTSPGEDYIHLYADYSQIEMNIATVYAEDNEMKNAIIGGIDIHLNAAENVFGKDVVYDKETGKVVKRYRTMAKGINFGTIYGMGAFSFVKNMNDMYGIILTKEEATNILEKWHSVFVGFRRFYGIAETVAKTTGQIRLWTGRRRRFVNPDTGQLYPKTQFRKAMNNIIQGAVAEMVKQASIRIDTILKSETASGKSRLVNFIHDDINMYIHKDDYHLVPAIKKAMEDFPVFTKSGIPVKVDVEYANWKGSWGAKDKWKPDKTLEEVFAVEEGHYNPPVKATPEFVWDMPVKEYSETVFKKPESAGKKFNPFMDHIVAFSGVAVSTTKHNDPYIRFEFTKIDEPLHFGTSMTYNIFLGGRKCEEYIDEIVNILAAIGFKLEDIVEDGKIKFSEKCLLNHNKLRKLVKARCEKSESKGKTYLNAVDIGPTDIEVDVRKQVPSPIPIA